MYPVPPIVLPPPAGLFDDVRAGISRPCAATRVPSATIDSCIDARRQAARHVARAGTRASPHWAHDASAAQRAYKSPLAADADTAGFLEEAFYLSESPVLQVRNPRCLYRGGHGAVTDDVMLASRAMQVSQPRTTMTTTLTTLASLAAVSAHKNLRGRPALIAPPLFSARLCLRHTRPARTGPAPAQTETAFGSSTRRTTR